MQEPQLAGKTALIVGGSKGIGQATAIALARCGARVIVSARHYGDCESVAKHITANAGEAQAIEADISVEAEVQALFDQAGQVDILINSAAVIHPIAPLVDAAPEEWLRNITVNVHGPFLTCHYALPTMLRSGWGRIINLSAGVASGRMTSWSAYSASKAGVETMTKVLAREVGDQGVHVNAVRPGIVDTDMQAEIRASDEARFGRENLERYRSYHERGVLRPAEHPARLLLWLLSPEAETLNGEILAIDDPEVSAKIGLTPIAR